MTITAKALLSFLVICLLFAAWMGRYDIKSSGSMGSAIILDRWTGITYWCTPHRKDADVCELMVYP